MKFDKHSLRELVGVEYAIEKKIEEDLIRNGFKIRKKIQIPKILEDLVGGSDKTNYI